MARRPEKPNCDDQAFEELVREHYATAYAAAFALLGDPHEASDAAQEAFLSVWCSLHQLKDTRKVRSWIKRIAVNAARAAIRKSWRTIPVDRIDQVAGEDRDDGPEELALRGDTIERLARAIRELGPEDRVLVTLHYDVGLPYGEIAEVMGIPVGTVLKMKTLITETTSRVLRASLYEAVEGISQAISSWTIGRLRFNPLKGIIRMN